MEWISRSKGGVRDRRCMVKAMMYVNSKACGHTEGLYTCSLLWRKLHA